MQQIPVVSEPTGKAAELLENVKASLGATPNIFTTLANAPAALEGFLGFSGALANGVLGNEIREAIALAVAGVNGCSYCAAAHTFIGDKSGIAGDELTRNLRGESASPKTQLALSFALSIVKSQGHPSGQDFTAMRDAGFSDEELVEIVTHVALNIFTNYFNESFAVDVDFPPVDVPNGI